MRGGTCQISNKDLISHYFESVDRIVQPDYVPSILDFLNIRVNASGIQEKAFQVNEFRYHFVHNISHDGFLSQSGKILHYFDDMEALIFALDISNYDQLYCDSFFNQDETS